MGINILKQLEATEQIVVKDLQIALLRAQNKTHEFKIKFEQDYKAVQNNVQKAANDLTTKLSALAKEAKIDTITGLQFEIDKLFFYVDEADKPVVAAVKTEAAKVEAVAETIPAKVEAVVKETATKVVDEAKGLVADVEKEIEKI